MEEGAPDRTDAGPAVLHVEPGDAPRTPRDPRGTVPWFPTYFLLEVAAGLIVLAALAVLSLVLDAPLLEIANPDVTPDPSKAPWYFLGLQELLHYYPPLVPSALVPAGVVAFLVCLPYLVRGERRPLWPADGSGGVRRLAWVLGVLVALLALAMIPAQHPPWLVLAPIAVLGGLAAAPAGVRRRGPVLTWLAARSVVDWVFALVVLEAVLLTLVGSLFRGPGWSWVWPWIEGVY